MFLRYILIFFVVFSNASFAQPTENRVALVLGNSAYKSAPLRNPTNDAKDMAAKLKGMGFTVVERNNLTVKQIGSTLREFRSKLTPGSVALVFYAGHGLQIKSFVEAQPASYLSYANGRNAVISLARSPNGDLLVEKIGFVK